MQNADSLKQKAIPAVFTYDGHTNSCTGTECSGWLFAQNIIADAEEM